MVTMSLRIGYQLVSWGEEYEWHDNQCYMTKYFLLKSKKDKPHYLDYDQETCNFWVIRVYKDVLQNKVLFNNIVESTYNVPYGYFDGWYPKFYGVSYTGQYADKFKKTRFYD